MRRTVTLVAALLLLLALTAPALAVSGHFIKSGANTPVCTDVGTTVECTGKVAGLGGTTFEVTVDAVGVASVTCANPGQNTDVPGQRTTVNTSGTTGVLSTPTNGQYVFTVATGEPSVPNYPTCPNPQWTATVVDVEFTNATLSLLEDDVLTDTVVVAVN